MKIDVDDWADNIISSLKKMADCVYARIQTDPDAGVKLHKSRPEIFSTPFVGKLIAIGRGDLDARLILSYCPARSAIARFTGNMQKQILDADTVLIASFEDNKVVKREKKIAELTPAESRLAFSEIGIRPIEEQAKLVQSAPVSSRVEKPCHYKIADDGKIIVREDAIFTLSQWEQILITAKSKAMKSLETKPKHGKAG